jgi:hypothetical protein
MGCQTAAWTGAPWRGQRGTGPASGGRDGGVGGGIVGAVVNYPACVLAALVILASVTPCHVVAAEVPVDYVVAVVGPEVISRYDVVAAWWIEGRPAVASSELVDELIDRQTLVAEGKRFGLQGEGKAVVTDAQVRALVDRIRGQGGAVEASTARRWLEDQAIITAYRRVRVDPFVRVSQAAVRAAFDDAGDAYAGRRFFEVEGEIRQRLLAEARRQRLSELLAELRGKVAIHRLPEEWPLRLE